MIVKVQISRGGNEPEQVVLVYNEDKTVTGLIPLKPHIRQLMDGRDRVFFHAELKGTVVDLGAEAPWQTW